MINWTTLLIVVIGILGFVYAKKIWRKKSDSVKVVSGIIAILGVLMLFGALPWMKTDYVAGWFSKPASVTQPELTSDFAGCPTDGDTSVTLNVYNVLNTSGSENYDVGYYVLDASNNIVTSGSDTTSPSSFTVNCGQNYKLAVVASNSDGGDGSQIKSTNIGTLTNGMVSFAADRANMNFNLEMSQHGLLQFKLYDNTNARFAYDTGDIENSAFELDGVTFTNGDNSTAFALGAGGYLDTVLKVQGNGVDTDFQDAYVLIAVEAPVTEYDQPSVKFNGVTLSDIKGTGLNADEVKALSGYEYVYKITAPMQDDISDVAFYIKATGAANPSSDVEVDFYAAGNYKATAAQTIKTGAVQDDSSKTVVFTVQDVTIDVS